MIGELLIPALKAAVPASKHVRPLELTQDRLKEFLDYDAATGIFIRKYCRYKQWVGKPAGTLTSNGYVHITVAGHVRLAHRLAWLYVHGIFPDCEIDHIDRNKTNNAIGNLRLVTSAENKWNANPVNINSTGFKGVRFCKRTRRFYAYIMKDGVRAYLGTFMSAEKAHEAYLAAARERSSCFTRAA